MSAPAIRKESSVLPLVSRQNSEPDSFRHADCELALPHLFAEQAAATPHALAVQCGSELLTYAELDKRSNQLARYLQMLGVGPDVPVGLYVERSLDFVTGALATMKAGGAYLPLDSAWPVERIAGVLCDAQVPVLLSHRWKPAGLPPGAWKTVDLDVCAPQIEALSAEPLRTRVTAEQLAYIIYTSGSTGQPKGVEITHGNLSTLIAWHTAEFRVGPQDRTSLVAGLGFDAAVWEIWPSLAAGASLHIAGEESRRSPESLREWLIAQQITIAFVPTAIAETLIAEPWPPCKLTRLLTGGDALRRYPIPALPFVLYNNYGPTECTVLVTSGLVRSAVDTAKSPSIGRPICPTDVHLLDENLLPVSSGAPGEICISGPRVGRGYRHRPELTAAKFVPNPFGDGLLFRTGDRACVLSSGEIAFLGRFDDQVKIRGYRIEPAEIVHALNQYPQISASLVIAREEALLAYLVFEAGTVLTASTLREFLSVTLPEYMIPALFISVKALPLTSSGKYDKAALPQPTAENTLPLHAPAASGASENETRLLRIVSALVGSDNISKDDNFFFIGGHSMLAAQLLVRIRQDFGVSLTLRQLFQAPTVAALCDSLQAVQSRAS